ncbi:MAG: tetratricopeptide repeat protein, partial [Candidatus Eisenbacteria bacterium]|nr:tetratricopeptide repeat protein [Candidatus Latescibacterota bacterium]MBD3303438.1 tetratricopeptide repeat protein [Candidatus Eisenbacteria bacterium]
MNPTLQKWGISLLLVVVSWLLFGTAQDHTRLGPPESELIWDNPAVAEGEVLPILQGRWQAGEYRPQVRPLATAFRAGEHALFGYDRGGYQQIQVLLHGVAAILVFFLLLRWLASPFLAALGGLLFVVHPAATHSVLYLGGLSEILATILFLGALLALTTYDERNRGAGLLFPLALGAMLTKETGFLLPLVALGILVADRSRPLSIARRFRPVGLALLAAILYRILVIVTTTEAYRRIPAVDPTSGEPHLSLLLEGLGGIAVQGSLVFLPLRLSHDHSWLLLLEGAERVAYVAAGVLLSAFLLFVAYRRGGERARTGLALLAILPLLAPALAPWIDGSLGSERHLYLALPGFIGLLLLLGRAIARRWPARRSMLVGIGVGIVLLFGVKSSDRVDEFASIDTLLAADRETYPENPQIHFEIGNRYMRGGDFESAVQAYRRALALHPRFALAGVNLGVAYIALEEWGLALRALDPAARLSKHVRSLRLVDARAHYHA